jgi:TP901 family phage tail tape measure protein
MAQFEVDFSESLSQLAQFQLRMANMGTALDALESKSGKSTSASRELLRRMNEQYNELERTLVAAGANTETLGKKMQFVRDGVAKLMSGMADANVKATVTAQAYNGELAELGRLLNDTNSKNTYSTWQAKTTQLTNKLAAENVYLREAIEQVGTAIGKDNANLKANLNHKQNMATADQRLRNTGDNLVLTLANLSGEQGKANVMTQAYIANRRSQITEEFRLDTQLRQLQKTLAGLTGGQEEEITKIQQLIAARKAEITESAREDLKLKQLRETLVSLTGGRQEEIAKVNAQIQARRQAIAESVSEKKVVDEMTAALKREEAQLVRLQAQSQMNSGYHGQRVAQLKAEIAEQDRHNKLIAMSTPQLLGFGAAQTKVNLSQELGSQSAAMLRAGLTGLHASVGVYTSATVLAATATYGISAALRDSIITGAEFYATMSRTKAVMSTGDTNENWLTHGAESSKALEMQVRALGQTTVFTASEVGDGLQQLGMAGLSANEALVALKPSLQLANLANVSMARSADISTNVLMTFGMQASELQSVVDLMATAVNNSNADIEQLANSLSYAGPAAKTAGFTIQDTTAAIETMANSGIKGSRSGSALRRMFTSLLNPTKKGSEVIQKYGLDILDAEGNTRSLSNIINQLSTKMKDLPGPERLAAITDLVGVYASSAVTGLVDNANLYNKFADQNMNVGGAGDRMEKIIADNLKFDWKEMLSSLEEVQLQAFSQLDGRLRESTASLTQYVLNLMEPYKAGTDITGLDRLLVQAQTAAEALAQVIAGIAAYKFATGNVFGALAADAAGAEKRLAVVGQRMQLTGTYMSMMGSSSDGARTKLELLNATAGRGATALGYLGSGAAWASGMLGKLAAGMGVLMRGLGWVGLIYGIGSALYDLWNTNTDAEVLKHRQEVDEVKSSYDKLKQSIEDTGLARQRAALKLQIKADKGSATDLDDQIRKQSQLITNGRAAGVSEENLAPLIKRLEGLQGLVGTYDEKVKASEDSLAKLGQTTNDYSTEADWQAKRVQNLINLTHQLTLAQGELAASQSRSGIGFSNLNLQQKVGKLTQEKAFAQQQVNLGTGQLVRVQKNIRPMSETLDSLRAESEAAAQEKIYKKTTSNAQQLLDVETKLTQAKKDQQKLIDDDAAAVAAGKTDLRPGLQKAELSVKTIADLEAKRTVLQQKMVDEQNELNQARESAAATQRSDNENMLAYQKTAADLAARIKTAENPGEGKAVDAKALTELYKDQAKVLGQIKSLETKGSKAGAKAAKVDDRQAQEDLRTYTALAKKFDEVTFSQLELAKGTAAMHRLRQGEMIDGKMVTITAEQEAKAIGELNLQHYKAVQALDLHAAALQKVKGSYNTSPFSQAAADLAVLNRALKENKISQSEHDRMTGNMRLKQKEDLEASLPQADLSVGAASDSPFTDWVSTEMTRAKGLEDFQKTLRNSKANEASGLAGIDDNFKQQLEELNARKLLEQGQEKEHTAKLLQINQDYQDQKAALVETAGAEQKIIVDKQAKYAEQMSTMSLMAAMGSVSNVLGMFASAASEASTAQKIAFAAQKAITIAQIIMYTELAAAQALAVSGNPMVLGMPMATFIRATGYANAALVGALAIGDLATGGQTSSGGGGGTKMYDTGGTIPYNRVGIVGEYGPELVAGPAHVTGRAASASRLGGDGSGETSITFAPVIQVTSSGGGTEQDQMKSAKIMGETVRGSVMAVLSEQMRPNGLLYKFVKQG